MTGHASPITIELQPPRWWKGLRVAFLVMGAFNAVIGLSLAALALWFAPEGRSLDVPQLVTGLFVAAMGVFLVQQVRRTARYRAMTLVLKETHAVLPRLRTNESVRVAYEDIRRVLLQRVPALRVRVFVRTAQGDFFVHRAWLPGDWTLEKLGGGARAAQGRREGGEGTGGCGDAGRPGGVGGVHARTPGPRPDRSQACSPLRPARRAPCRRRPPRLPAPCRCLPGPARAPLRHTPHRRGGAHRSQGAAADQARGPAATPSDAISRARRSSSPVRSANRSRSRVKQTPIRVATPKARWRVSAAWKATVEDGLVAEWCVYCDTSWTRREG